MLDTFNTALLKDSQAWPEAKGQRMHNDAVTEAVWLQKRRDPKSRA